jgi:capsular exopolysaccharide synthesis family protein
VLRILWINKWIIALIASIFVGFAGYYAFTATPLYTSTATIVLETRQDQVVDLDSVVTGLGSIAGDPAVIATEVEIMRSRSLLTRVINRLDLESDPEFNPELAEPGPEWMKYLSLRYLAREAFVLAFGDQATPEPIEGGLLNDPDFLRREIALRFLEAAIQVENIPFSYVFTISTTTQNPEKSAQITNELAEVYILAQLDAKFEATQRATTWLSERVAELKTSLQAAEAAVEEYASSTTLVSEEALAVANKQLKDMRERRAGEATRADTLRASKEVIQAQYDAGDFEAAAAALQDPRLRNFADRLRGASGAERDALKTQFDSLYQRNLSRIDVDALRADEQVRSLTQAVQEIEQRLEAQSADLVELRQLQREAEAAGLLYEYFLGRMKETSVQQGIQQPDSRILSAATPPFQASWPSKSSIVAFAGAVGLFFGFAVVFAKEMFQTAYRSPDQLESGTGVTVMGMLPSAPSTRRKAVLEYQMKKPTSQLAEAVRNLRTSILLSRLDQTPKVIMVCSSVPAESKTTTTLLLAHNSAMMGKKVLVIECDLRRRTFTDYFDAKGDVGLLSILTGAKTADEVIHHDEATGLDVIIGQRSSANAADVFASDRFAELIAEMRGRYDFVYIDTPPVLAVPDARVIAQHADAVLYCVKWDSTDRGAVESGLDLFAQANVKVTGLALTRANPRKISRYGFSGYGYGYGSSGSKRYYTG